MTLEAITVWDIFFLPLVDGFSQQSLLDPSPQLFCPQTRPSAQSASLSQSPSPSWHLCPVVSQQLLAEPLLGGGQFGSKDLAKALLSFGFKIELRTVWQPKLLHVELSRTFGSGSVQNVA